MESIAHFRTGCQTQHGSGASLLRSWSKERQRAARSQPKVTELLRTALQHRKTHHVCRFYIYISYLSSHQYASKFTSDFKTCCRFDCGTEVSWIDSNFSSGLSSVHWTQTATWAHIHHQSSSYESRWICWICPKSLSLGAFLKKATKGAMVAKLARLTLRCRRLGDTRRTSWWTTVAGELLASPEHASAT